MATYFALHMCATNDRNGNPRRYYAVFRNSKRPKIVAVVDEGYRGEDALVDAGFAAPVVAHFATTPADRKAILGYLPHTMKELRHAPR